jgi:hypothetical protein
VIFVQTYIEQAQTRIRTESESLDAKRDAFDAFAARVESLDSASTQQSSSVATTAGVRSKHTSATERDCRAVRQAFAETIHPHSGTESVLDAIRDEFSDSVAGALAPTTGTPFSPKLKRLLLSATATRQTEIAALRAALDREATQLAETAERVDHIVSWLTETDETPLSDLEFEALRKRHETLATHRGTCEQVVERRQAFLDTTTNKNGAVGVDHRSLPPSLYEDFPVDHPVLATATCLENVCANCQEVVRTHLVRRV